MTSYTEEDLIEMTRHYLIAMLWSTPSGEELEEESEHLDGLFEVDDLPVWIFLDARKECREFLDKAIASRLLDGAHSFEQVGHDFWLTRNHHGVGFWDRPEIYGEHKDTLTELAEGFGERYPSTWRDEETGELRITVD